MKKNQLLFFFLLFSMIGCKEEKKENTMAPSYIVNKSATACACFVQTPQEKPQLGAKHLGPFATKQLAIDAMCSDLDPTMTDRDKCWATVADACGAAKATADAPPALYNYGVIVRPLKQPKSMDCWATALTMLYSWKNNDNTIGIKDVLSKYGENYVILFQTNAGIKAVDEEALYKKANLKIVKGLNPSIDGWYQYLKSNGPLSITVDADPPKGTIHALVIDGIRGDGTSAGTKIEYIDPADGKQHSLPFSEFIKLYEGSANWPLQIICYP